MPTNAETLKIELILSKEQKETIEKAAAAKCPSLNDYLLEIAVNAARETPELEQIVLSDRDWEIFTSALENPPEPNEALKAAVKQHQEKYGNW